jgi:hypothetical protein
VGYADGYLRELSNRGEALVRGHRVPILGTVCMGMVMVDLTDLPDAQVATKPFSSANRATRKSLSGNSATKPTPSPTSSTAASAPPRAPPANAITKLSKQKRWPSSLCTQRDWRRKNRRQSLRLLPPGAFSARRIPE